MFQAGLLPKKNPLSAHVSQVCGSKRAAALPSLLSGHTHKAGNSLRGGFGTEGGPAAHVGLSLGRQLRQGVI